MQTNKTKQPAGERARDEQRADRGPAYGGEAWEVADERAPEERYGHARNDDAEPSETMKAGEGPNEEDDNPTTADAETDTGETETGGQQAGMNRGDTPRKTKSRAKR